MSDALSLAHEDNTPPFVASTEDCCMGNALFGYLEPKVHHEIRSKDWPNIVVRGKYAREATARPSDNEKKDKPFNWHRPTAEILDDTTLYLNCFPGQDYVKHYASIIGTYLALTKRSLSSVRYELPSSYAAEDIYMESNLGQMGSVDIVIIGYVWHLDTLFDAPWEGDNSTNIFAWRKMKSSSGKTIAVLGCMPSFWGDISGALITALHKLNNVKCVLYIGKAGSLDDGDLPNQIIATGNCSSLGEEAISWKSVLNRESSLSSKVASGKHTTTPTPLCESRSWFQKWQKNARWVDCEVGHMAKACNKGGIEFGYLHIISDNLIAPEPYNMSNERLPEVRKDRSELFREIIQILKNFLAREP